MAQPKNSVDDFEQAARLAENPTGDPAQAPTYVLQLFVAGATPQSSRALTNLKEICETHLRGHYELEVVDVYQRPGLAKADRIIAIPTLLKKLPSPLRRLVGDLSDKERVLVGLNLKPKPP